LLAQGQYDQVCSLVPTTTYDYMQANGLLK